MIARKSAVLRRSPAVQCGALGVAAQLGRTGLGPMRNYIKFQERSKISSAMVNEDTGLIIPDVSHHRLEKELGDNYTAVQMRRDLIALEIAKGGDEASQAAAAAVFKVPAAENEFNVREFYDQVHGTACENVIGFIPVPVGVIGPLLVNGEELTVPLASTEGALLASTNRGAHAIRESGGAFVSVVGNGMTRSPVVNLPSAMAAVQFKAWVETKEVLEELRAKFSETTSFGKLKSVNCTIAGRHVYMRFLAETGDAMGMNMVGKGVNCAMEYLLKVHADSGIKLVSLSSNMCTDKKPSAMNWIQGRGKSVVAEVVLPRQVVESVLKTTVEDMSKLNVAKNLVGSALAGSIGGNNAHASNLVTAFFIANGQDPAQNVESSNCMVLMEVENGGEALRVSATMPSLEVGTIGGGTQLSTQRACLEILGVAGSNHTDPGANAKKLATIACATVLAGELSLNAALASNHLISAHMDLNRKSVTIADGTKSTLGSASTDKKFEQSMVQPGYKK